MKPLDPFYQTKFRQTFRIRGKIIGEVFTLPTPRKKSVANKPKRRQGENETLRG